MKVQVIIDLEVPNDFQDIGEWTKEECLYDFVSHWLEEGYYIHDQIVELPHGIEFQGFEIKEIK